MGAMSRREAAPPKKHEHQELLHVTKLQRVKKKKNDRAKRIHHLIFGF